MTSLVCSILFERNLVDVCLRPPPVLSVKRTVKNWSHRLKLNGCARYHFPPFWGVERPHIFASSPCSFFPVLGEKRPQSVWHKGTSNFAHVHIFKAIIGHVFDICIYITNLQLKLMECFGVDLTVTIESKSSNFLNRIRQPPKQSNVCQNWI